MSDWVDTVLIIILVPWLINMQRQVSWIKGYLNRKREEVD